MRERLVIIVPLLLAVALNAALVAGAARLRGVEAQLLRAHEAKAAVHGVVAGLSDVEAGLGAYVATLDRVFLEPFERMEERLPSAAQHLREAVGGPGEDEGGRDALIAAARAHLDVLLRMRDQAGPAGGPPRALIAEARRARQAVQAAAAQLTFREDERASDARASARVLQIWVLVSALGAALAGLACGATAWIVLSGRRAAQSAPAPAPAAAGDAGPAAGPAPADVRIDGIDGPASVLIVDDDRHIRELLQRWLRPHGLELRQAADAQAALAAIAEQAPTVVLCDIHMPGRSGLWLAERVRDVAPGCAIVLATGDDTVPPFESLKAGVVAYVLKPFRREQLVAAVREGVRWSVTEGGRQRPIRPAEAW